MKKKTTILPKKLLYDIDLDYIKKLSDQKRRVALFYEYARNSSPIKELVRGLRKSEVFKEGPSLPMKPDDYPTSAEFPTNPDYPTLADWATNADLFWMEVATETYGKLNAMTVEQVVMLAKCDGFPDRPYKGLSEKPACPLKFGIHAPVYTPWHRLDMVRKFWKNAGLDELGELKRQCIYPITLPFQYCGDSELLDHLAPIIKALRPKDYPPPQPGRKGSSKGTVDMINQLKAYRLHVADYDFDLGKLHITNAKGRAYTTKEGWNKAIREAEKRINGMMD